MTSLQDADSTLRAYFIKHSLPQIYKALLAGLCVSCPEDPLHFIEEKILEILENRDLEIYWAWKRYILKRKTEAARLLERMEEAERYHTRRKMRLSLLKWTAWVRYHKQNQNDAVEKLQKVQKSVYCRNTITAWRLTMQDAKRLKEYFKKLERDIQKSLSSEIQGDGQDRLSLLPNKLSLKIFQNLGVGDLLRCAQVCRSWKAITQVSSLWTEMNFSSESCWITDETVGRLLRAHRVYVTSVNLCGCAVLQWSSLRCISQCKNLQELNLSECPNVNDEIIKMILEGCHSLLHINLAFTDITNTTIQALSRCCLTLRSLNLAYCTNISDEGLQNLTTGKGCHRLIQLDLSGCSQITADGFSHVADACGSLQEIVLDDLPTLTDACVQALVSKCRTLTVISVLDSPYLSDVAFKAIAEVTSLTKFQIEGNNRIADSSWKALCRSSPKLSEVHACDCPRVTDNSLKFLGSLTKLHNLNISGCIKVTDTGIRYITDGPCAVKMRELDLSNCSRVTDLSLKKISQRCDSLIHLSVCFCDNLSDNGFEFLDKCASLIALDITGCKIHDQGLAALGSIHSLRKLTAIECAFITDNGIKVFCRQCRHLELLDVSHCVSLSDRAMKALSFFCKTIATVRIAGCFKMTDTAVKYLTRAGHFLRELDVSGCSLLTDHTPSFMMCSCPHLRSVNMLYCRNISKQAALKLRCHVQQWKHSDDDPPLTGTITSAQMEF
ncbi:dynein regulatory complex subunit 6 [Triplophysa dalaica]|uniref:dynein regulatory complex subunit 6 n=1 Tax=Triplophysa dalaica TaxID=1582913 RepID=UPI0024DFAF03|nr:dynein regulatory complex subunit 6 [Triplophysa dalaica]